MSLRPEKEKIIERNNYRKTLLAKYREEFGKLPESDDNRTKHTIISMQRTIEEKDKDIIELTDIIDTQQKSLEKLDGVNTEMAADHNKLVASIEAMEKEKATIIKNYAAEMKKKDDQLAKYKTELDSIKEKFKSLTL